jgi:hypothetical protein
LKIQDGVLLEIRASAASWLVNAGGMR